MIGASMPASRSCTPSSTRATPSQVAPALERGPRDRHRAVAVPVGLDHREQLGGRRQIAQRARRWRGSRRGRPRSTPHVSLGVSPVTRLADAHAESCATPAAYAAGRGRDRRRRGRGRRSPPSRRRSAPCTHAAAAAAAKGAIPRARNPATMPVSTSPLPAVASSAPPVGFSATRPPGAATTVPGPFSSTTAPDALGQRARGLDAVVAHRSAHEPLVLALVRREHRRRAQRATGVERGEVAVERVEPVGVEHERRRASATSVRTTSRDVGVAARARDRRPARRTDRSWRAPVSAASRASDAVRGRGQWRA